MKSNKHFKIKKKKDQNVICQTKAIIIEDLNAFTLLGENIDIIIKKWFGCLFLWKFLFSKNSQSVWVMGNSPELTIF